MYTLKCKTAHPTLIILALKDGAILAEPAACFTRALGFALMSNIKFYALLHQGG
jgi:hypothetical protein